MKWAVEVLNTGLDKPNLIDLLKKIGYHLIHKNDSYVIYSEKLDKFQNTDEVWTEAQKTAYALNGPSSTDPQFKLGALIDYSNGFPKMTHFIKANSILVQMNITSPKAQSLPPSNSFR